MVSWEKTFVLTMPSLRDGGINKGVPVENVGFRLQKEGKDHTWQFSQPIRKKLKLGG